MVLGLITVHNINVDSVVLNNKIPTDEKEANKNIMHTKANQKAILYLPVFPCRALVSKTEKNKVLNLLHSKLPDITKTL